MFISDIFAKNQIGLVIWTHVCVFSIPLICVSDFVPISHYFDYYGPAVQLEIRYDDNSLVLFSSKLLSTICGLFFHVNFKVIFLCL